MKHRGILLATTIMDGLIAVIGIALLVITLPYVFVMKDMAGTFMGNISSIDPESVTAGYEVLGNLFMSGVAGFGWMLVLAAIVISVIAVLCFLIPSISGIVCLIKYGDPVYIDMYAYTHQVKVDSILKLIFNSIPAVILLNFLRSTEISAGILGALIYLLIVIGLSIKQLVNLND